MGATFNRIDQVDRKPQTDSTGEIDITDREPTADELDRVEALSEEQFKEIARSSEYKNSSLARALAIEGRRKAVAEEIAAEDTPEAHAARQQNAVERIGNRRAAELAVGQAEFRNPRYKVDAAYRFEVAQRIATTQQTHGQGGTHQLTVGRGEPGQVVHHQRSGPMRVEFSPKMTGAEKPEKLAPVKPEDPGVVDLYPYR